MIVGFYRGSWCRKYSVSYQNKRFNTLRLASKNWKASNLEILKFEARASHSSGQILAGFLRLSFLNFFQMTRLVKAFYSKEIYGLTDEFAGIDAKIRALLKNMGNSCVGAGLLEYLVYRNL